MKIGLDPWPGSACEGKFRHHLALRPFLAAHDFPHFPRFPAKKMSQQYGRRSRGPGRVPRAAPRQPGCTVEQTNHEPRSFLARGASRREFRGFHESRITARIFSPWVRQGGATGNRRPDHCARRQVTVSRFTVVHDCSHCSLLFTIVRHCSDENIVWSQCPRAARSLLSCAPWGGYRAACAGGGVGGETVSLPRQPFSVGLATSVARRAASAAANTK